MAEMSLILHRVWLIEDTCGAPSPPPFFLLHTRFPIRLLFFRHFWTVACLILRLQSSGRFGKPPGDILEEGLKKKRQKVSFDNPFRNPIFVYFRKKVLNKHYVFFEPGQSMLFLISGAFGGSLGVTVTIFFFHRKGVHRDFEQQYSDLATFGQVRLPREATNARKNACGISVCFSLQKNSSGHSFCRFGGPFLDPRWHLFLTHKMCFLFACFFFDVGVAFGGGRRQRRESSRYADYAWNLITPGYPLWGCGELQASPLPPTSFFRCSMTA